MGWSTNPVIAAPICLQKDLCMLKYFYAQEMVYLGQQSFGANYLLRAHVSKKAV